MEKGNPIEMDISELIEKETNKSGLAQFMRSLDERSRAILGYLYWRRHADISELRLAADSADDSEVLFRLKEVINGKSQSLWGKPVVSFEQSKVDPATGEKILFSWWYLDEEEACMPDKDNSLVDIFNEKDSVVIMAQLPASVELAGPEIQFKNGILRIKLKKIEGKQSDTGVR
jgi:hypothetical protein